MMEIKKIKKTRALRNAIASVADTAENYDCTESYLETLEMLHRMLFVAEMEEGLDNEPVEDERV